MTTYAHPEAFCLMQYRSDDGPEVEVLWNSRDGVTPFVITLRSGKTATHVAWNEDVRCTPGMAASLGVRRFIDHTPITAHAAAVPHVDEYWDHPQYPMKSRFESKAEAIAMFVNDWVGTPTIVEA